MDSYRAQAQAQIMTELRRRNERAALTVETNVRDVTPVDTGNLRARITHDSDDDGFVVGTNVHYAPYVELGTRYMAPQPFLRRGLRDSIGDLQRIYGEEVG